jgi:glutathione S-transferase
MGVVLYGATDTNAWRVQWVLNELEIVYKHVDFDIHAEGARSHLVYAEIARLNPHGTVPVLTRGNDIVWDSLAINLYLADAYEQLLPAAGLMLAVQWSLWVSGLEERIRTVQLHHSNLPEKMRQPETAAKARDSLIDPFTKLDTLLGQSPYLDGHSFTIADLNTMCVLAHVVEGEFDENRWLHLKRWMSKCGSREALTSIFR